MVNKQLFDYISQQMKLGASKEIIRSSLMSQNWSEQDVNEGFTVVEKSNVVPTLSMPIHLQSYQICLHPIQEILPVFGPKAYQEPIKSS